MPAERLGLSEFVVLGVLARRRDGDHGTALLDELEGLTGRRWSVGALYTILGRLEDKGLVVSAWSEPILQRGGRRRRVFQVLDPGRDLIRETLNLMIAAGGLADSQLSR